MKSKKIFLKIILICFIIVINLQSVAFADEPKETYGPPTPTPTSEPGSIEPFSLKTMIQQARDFLTKGDPLESVINVGNLKIVSNSIYKILLTLAIIVAVIIGAVLGIQFIMASAEDKAQIKEALVPYFVGCIIVFSAFTIWKVAVNTLKRISGDNLEVGEVTENPSPNPSPNPTKLEKLDILLNGSSIKNGCCLVGDTIIVHVEAKGLSEDNHIICHLEDRNSKNSSEYKMNHISENIYKKSLVMNDNYSLVIRVDDHKGISEGLSAELDVYYPSQLGY